AMGAAIGPPGEAMEELDSPYHRCFAVVPAELTGCSVTGNYRQPGASVSSAGDGPPSLARLPTLSEPSSPPPGAGRGEDLPGS
ncbi:hypothetical protein THAOC_07388, partial [Thalassiosira oceanica]